MESGEPKERRGWTDSLTEVCPYPDKYGVHRYGVHFTTQASLTLRNRSCSENLYVKFSHLWRPAVPLFIK